MQRNLAHEILVRHIQKFGSEAQDHRQVQRRLQQLLPARLQLIIQGLRQDGVIASRALRQALASAEYLHHMEELIDVMAATHESRVQYETHLMLLEARRSLRAFRR